MTKKLLSFLLLAAIVLQLAVIATPVAQASVEDVIVTNSATATPPNTVVTTRKDYKITDGVTESHIVYNDASGENQISAFMMTVAPDAQVTFKASYSGYYNPGSTAESRAKGCGEIPWALSRPTAQAAAYEAATGEKVLFATNADFYDVKTFQPLGYVVMEGNVLQTYGKVRKQPYFAVLKDGSFAIRDFGTPLGDVSEAVSGCWLVRDGKNVTDTYYHSLSYVNTRQPMNAIGITADGTLITFVADGRQAPYSVGLVVHDLAELFVSMGCINAIDLDGGGSATFASVHEGSNKLVVRNSPSDGSERAIANALLMVAADRCKHDYSRNYQPKADGTHGVSCALCNKTIVDSHKYKNGVCVCGVAESSGSCLYFDFGNQDADRYRYQSDAYQHVNFDMAPSNPWSGGSAWATAHNGEYRNHFSIDNDEGVLRADVTEDGNGPWIAPTNAYGVFPWFVDTAYGYFPLQYIPREAEYFQIRFKLTGCEAVADKSPYALIQYYYVTEGTQSSATDIRMECTLQDDGYQTYTIPLPEKFTSADVINGFALRFYNILSTSGGQVAIDYIYFGPEETLPSNKQLFFDFTGTQAAQERYNAKTYGMQNFDDASAWQGTYLTSTKKDGVQVDKSEGTVTLSKSADNAYSYSYLMTKPNLWFDPTDAEFLQMRFKLSDFAPASSKTRFTLNYYTNGEQTQYMDAAVYSFGENFVFDGEYMTLTLPISDAFRSSKFISKIKMNFWELGGVGTVTFDYIYIGPKETLPTQKQLYFDFGNTLDDRARYSTKTYGAQNFDDASAWYGTKLSANERDDVQLDPKEGTVTLTQGVNNGYSYSYIMPKSNLWFDPTDAQYLQMRLKLSGFEPASSKTRFALNYYANGAFTQYMDAAGYSFGEGFVFDGEYMTLTLPIYDAFRNSKYISNVKMNFWNLDGVGTVTFDYIYIGPEETLPSQKQLYFGFSNGEEDQVRYSTKTYGAQNFDDASAWVGTALSNGQRDTVRMDPEETAVTLTKSANNSLSYFYLMTKQKVWFDPSQAEFLQMRVKLSGFEPASSKTRFALNYYANGASAQYVDAAVYSFGEGFVFDGEYLTLTLPINDAFRNSKYISDIKMNFWELKGEGTVTFDYIYIGAKDTLPVPLYTVTFLGADGQILTTQSVHKGETATYTGATPTKAYDAENHYAFKGWDKPLSNITADMTVSAQFLATAHSYRYSNNGDGTHTGDCAYCDRILTEAHKFEGEACFCGGKVLTVDESIRIYHTLDLASDISVTFAVPMSALANYDSYYLECVLPEYDGNELSGTSTVKIDPVVNGNYYYFTLTGITAVRMGDLVDATLHMTRGTAQYISATDTYSVATYAYDMLNSSSDTKMLTLCADLLRYGAEAQRFKKYRSDALVDAAMTEAQRAYLSATENLSFTATDSFLGDLANPTISWVGKTLDLGSKIGMKFVFNTKNYSGDIANLSMKVSYMGGNGEIKTAILTGAEAYGSYGSYYSFTFYGMLASELRTVMDVAIYEGGTQLSETLRYSAESYASKNTSGALADLCNALFAYSDSAKAYFTK